MPSISRTSSRAANPAEKPVSRVAADQMTKTGAVDPVDVIAVHQPAGRDLQQRVSPEERREEAAELFRIEVEFVGHHLAANRKASAIDIVDADG
jgi:hypothetical protein